MVLAALSHPTFDPQAALGSPTCPAAVSLASATEWGTHVDAVVTPVVEGLDVMSVVWSQASLTWTGGGARGGIGPQIHNPAFTASIHGWASWGALGWPWSGGWPVLVCILGPECMQMVEMWLRLENG